MVLLSFTVEVTLCRGVSVASPSTDVVVADPIVVCTEFEALVGTCSPRVLPTIDGLEIAVEPPLANVEECVVVLEEEEMVAVVGIEFIGVAVVFEKLFASSGLAALDGKVE